MTSSRIFVFGKGLIQNWCETELQEKRFEMFSGLLFIHQDITVILSYIFC